MQTSVKESILVVDDVEANVDILVEMLGVNYDVRVSMDGETALQAVEANPPQLILLDIMMPKIDGFEVCKRLKANMATSSIPVIFISARDDNESIIKAFAFGGVDYICKPFNPNEVRARVETHLELAWIRREFEESLSQTLTGTIRILSDILAMLSPELASFSARLHAGMKAQCLAHGLEPSWPFELAGMLMPLGMLAMEPDLVKKINSGAPLDVEIIRQLDNNVKQSAQMLARIPQLDKTVEVIRQSTLTPWELQENSGWETLEKVNKAALILRLLRESPQCKPELLHSTLFIPTSLNELYGMPIMVR